MLLGTPLMILIGPTVPVPPPPTFGEALESVSVQTSDSGRAGFQITLRAGRGAADLLDYDLLAGPLLRPFSRVVLMVAFNAVPEVLIDGIITNQQLSPGAEPGTTTVTVTGEDVSVMMDLEEKSVEAMRRARTAIAPIFAQQSIREMVRTGRTPRHVIDDAQFGMIPMIIPPPSIDIPLPIERIPTQQGTDLQYLQEMASRFGYVFYVVSGPAPLTNTAYWGPPVRVGIPQRALSVNVGPTSNVSSIDFQHDGLAQTFVSGSIQDRLTNQSMPVQTFASTRPPLVREPAWATQRQTRTVVMRESGLDSMQAFARAQGRTDEASDEVVTASGELDAIRYEGILRPRGLVGLRGVGDTYGGMYYVKQVSHSISEGSYTQQFTLTREGTGYISPVVVP